jgi:hypothetical protein
VRHKNICSICGGRYVGVGHNALPMNDGFCCDDCERFVVVPAQVRSIMQREERRRPDPKPAGEAQPHYGSDEQMFGAK